MDLLELIYHDYIIQLIQWLKNYNLIPIIFLPLIAIPFWFIQKFYELKFRETLTHIIFLLVGSIFFITISLLCFPFHSIKLIPLIISVSICIIGITMLFIFIRNHLIAPRLPDETLHIAIAQFRPISSGAEQEAHNIPHRIEQMLLKKIKHGAPIKISLIKNMVDGIDDDEKNKIAVSLGRNNPAHVVIWGDVRRDAEELYVKPNLTVSIQMQKANIKDRKFDEFINTEPNEIEFKETVSKEIADITTYIYGYACYKAEDYDNAITIFEQVNKREADFYRGLSLQARSQICIEPKQDLQASIDIFKMIINSATNSTSSHYNEIIGLSKVNLANALTMLSMHSEGPDSLNLLRDAIDIYKSTLESCEKTEPCIDITLIEMNLSVSFYNLGKKLLGDEGKTCLYDAIQYIKLAIETLKKHDQADKLIFAYNNLGIFLRELANRSAGEESISLLKESLNAYNSALAIDGKSQMPIKWAAIQNNMGITFYDLALQHEDKLSISYLEKSLKAYQLASDVRKKSITPQKWAETQNNTSMVLRELGIRKAGTIGLKMLEESINACRLALEVRTKTTTPQNWASTQINLSLALRELGTRLNGERGIVLLQESVNACRSALEVRTRSSLPLNWASAQNNLGNALRYLGLSLDGAEGKKLLKEAIEAYRSTLEVITKTDQPQTWAFANNNLGETLYDLSVREEDKTLVKTLLREAIQANKCALEFYTRSHLPKDFAMINNNIGLMLIKLGEVSEGEMQEQYFNDALECFNNAIEVLNEINDPELSKMIHTNREKLYRVLT